MFSLRIDAESIPPSVMERVEGSLTAPRVVPGINDLTKDEQRDLLRAEMKRNAARRRQATRGR